MYYSFVIFFLLFVYVKPVSSYLCDPEGCTVSGCKCPEIWTYCNTEVNSNGVCFFTCMY
jgi:hypothetical protein